MNESGSRTSNISTLPFGKCGCAAADGISRAIYVTAAGRRVVVLRVFVKKTEKTPRREIDLALQRVKEIIQ